MAASSEPARAASFVLETGVAGNTGCNPAGPYGGPGQCLNDEDPVNFQTFGPDTSYPPGVGAGFISTSGPYLLNNGDTMLGSAMADADFFQLMVQASVSYNLSSPETAFLVGFGHVIEELTIDAPGLTGTSGTLDVTYQLDGTVSYSGSAFAGVVVGVQWGGSEPFNQDEGAFEVYSTSTSVATTVSVPFTYGDPFFLAMLMVGFAGTGELCFTCPDVPIAIVERTGAGAGSSDFFNTMALSGLLPFDANGNIVEGATFSSASGTRYSEQGVVPEPGTLLLVGAGLAGIARRVRQRTRRSPRTR